MSVCINKTMEGYYEKMKTLNKKSFQYKSCDREELIIYPSDKEGNQQKEFALVITTYTINLIKSAIKQKGKILMGASRDKPPKDSLGALLKKEGQTPQQLSYLIPILIDEGFCDYTKKGKAFVITYKVSSGYKTKNEMPWWNKILNCLSEGDVLFTPGRGLMSAHRSTFLIIKINDSRILIKSGKSTLSLERKCFDAIEEAFKNDPNLWLRVASIRANEPLENSADELIRTATGSSLARGNYVCSILEKCRLVRYAMRGNRKGIKLP